LKKLKIQGIFESDNPTATVTWTSRQNGCLVEENARTKKVHPVSSQDKAVLLNSNGTQRLCETVKLPRKKKEE
jgi:hypothetical protein